MRVDPAGLGQESRAHTLGGDSWPLGSHCCRVARYTRVFIPQEEDRLWALRVSSRVKNSREASSSIATALTPAPFKVSSEQEAGAVVILVQGELDMNTAAKLERELEVPLSAPDSALLIDLSRCEFIDSTGIALLVRAWQRLDGDGRFALCGINNQVERVLEITGLESTIPTHASREQALAQLGS